MIQGPLLKVLLKITTIFFSLLMITFSSRNLPKFFTEFLTMHTKVCVCMCEEFLCAFTFILLLKL